MSTQEFAKVCMRRKSIANSKHSTGLHVLQTDCKLKYLHKSLQRFAHWPFRQPPLLRSVCHQVPIQGLRVCKSGKLMQIKHLQQVCLRVCTRAYQIFRPVKHSFVSEACFPLGEFVHANSEKSNLPIGWRQTLTPLPANHIRFLLARAKNSPSGKRALQAGTSIPRNRGRTTTAFPGNFP